MSIFPQLSIAFGRLTACAVMVGGLWLMAGCATAPDLAPAPDIDLPAAWSRTVGQSAPEPWLSDFEDPQLAELVGEALRRNAELERVTALLGQRIAEAKIRGADLMPAADFGLNGARQKINTFGPTSTGGVIFENYELSLNLSWELDLWGRLRDRTSAALAEVELGQAELHGARLSLAAQVAKSWFNLAEATQQLAEAERTAAAYVENQRSLEDRFQRGLTEGVDLRRIRTLAAGAAADVATRRRSLDAATRQLEQILGRYPGADLAAYPRLPDLPPPPPAGLPAELIARRPDLVAAERRLAAAGEEVTASRKDLLPRLSLTSNAGTSSREFDDLLDGDFEVWALAGNLTQPIFQGGRLLAAIDRAASLQDQARAAYRNAALQAFLEVETSLAAENYLREQYAQVTIAADEANAAEAQLWERYRKGTADFLAALDAQRTAASARSRRISVRNALLQNRIDLYLALGGPFAPEPGAEPTTTPDQ